MTTVPGLDFEEASRTRIHSEVDGRQIPFLGRDALIKNERSTGRAKDLADVERLEGDRPRG